MTSSSISMQRCLSVLCVVVLVGGASAFQGAIGSTAFRRSPSSTARPAAVGVDSDGDHFQAENTDKSVATSAISRRSSLGLLACGLLASSTLAPSIANADASTASQVTDKIYLDVKGIPQYAADGTQLPPSSATQRIVIGLFGEQAPDSTNKLKQLVSGNGLPAECKPREERTLQREQLEANKVYNSCVEGQDKGVTYDYAQVWRILANERIDVGAVAGRFVARESPFWSERSATSLPHDRAGLVSVKRGTDSGFGFTILPSANKDLDGDFIVVGQVIEGMDIVQQINAMPVVRSSNVSYMALSGGPKNKSAPTRSCRYGSSDLYCNENKPLQKLTILRTGVLS